MKHSEMGVSPTHELVVPGHKMNERAAVGKDGQIGQLWYDCECGWSTGTGTDPDRHPDRLTCIAVYQQAMGHLASIYLAGPRLVMDETR